MNIIFLPDKIRQTVGSELDSTSLLLRCSGSLSGNTGEGYIIGLKDELWWFDRPSGSSEFRAYRESYRQPALALKLEEENYSLRLRIGSPQGDFIGVLTPADREPVQLLIASLKAAHDRQPANEAVSARPSPLTGMLAGMLLVAGCDGAINAEEDFYLRRFFGAREELREAENLIQGNTVDAIIRIFAAMFSREQALCLLSNMIEIGMIDGSWSGAEQQLIWQFGAGMGVADAELQNIVAVLLMKNKWAVMK